MGLSAQAFAAIITGEWFEMMMSDLNIRSLRFQYPVSEYFQGEGPFTVYTGPGKQYAVLAENVEVKQLFELAGMVGSWALVTSDYGTGYVDTQEFANRPDVEQLRFAGITTTAYCDCCILKDTYFRYPGQYLAIIPKGAPMILLSECNGYVYAEANVNGSPVRGFLYEYGVDEWERELNKAGYFTEFYSVDLRELYAYQYAVLKKDSVGVGLGYTVGIKADGTCVAEGLNDYGQCDVDEWENIIAVSAGRDHTVGLKSDGTVVAAGRNDKGQCDVQNWRNIVAVSAGYKHTVGLTEKGRVVVTGDNTLHQHDLGQWLGINIVAINAGSYYTIALTSDGHVLSSGLRYDPAYEYFLDFEESANIHGISIYTEKWEKIVDICAGGWHALALTGDGKVDGVGETCSGQMDHISDWEDVRVIAASANQSFALKEDGTVVEAAYNDTICSGWDNVVFMDASDLLLVGVTKEGTVLTEPRYTWYDEYPDYDLSDWTDIGLAADAVVFQN